MELRLFFLPNFPGATFIQGTTFIPDSRVLPLGPFYTIQTNFMYFFAHDCKIPRIGTGQDQLKLPNCIKIGLGFIVCNLGILLFLRKFHRKLHTIPDDSLEDCLKKYSSISCLVFILGFGVFLSQIFLPTIEIILIWVNHKLLLPKSACMH